MKYLVLGLEMAVESSSGDTAGIGDLLDGYYIILISF
jgi:hypothetical protein